MRSALPVARKLGRGELTPAERREYEQYVMAGHVVAIFQARARILLARRGPSA